MAANTDAATNDIIESLRDLKPEELLQRLQGTATPYPERMPFSECDYKLHTSPTAVMGSRMFLRPLPKSLSKRRNTASDSRLESLPNEVLLQIIHFLDIESLVRFAASSSLLRALALSCLNVGLVKSSGITCLALSSMLRAGTARYFTLQRFIDTVSSSKCAICETPNTFAPWLCLILCQRVCPHCILKAKRSVRLPKSMALACLSLDAADLDRGLGTATATLPPTFERSPRVGMQSTRIIRRENKIQVVTLTHALNLSVKKHANLGGDRHVKSLLESYLRRRFPRPDPDNRYTSTPVTSEYTVSGLTNAIHHDWPTKTAPSPDSVLFTYMPYYPRPSPSPSPPTLQTPPLQFSTGLLCEGCLRHAIHLGYLTLHRSAPDVPDHHTTAYLLPQYLDHLAGCHAAKAIFRGERLNIAQENELKELMERTVNRSQGGVEARNIVQSVNFDAEPKRVREGVEAALRQVMDIGNRYMQMRAGVRWERP